MIAAGGHNGDNGHGNPKPRLRKGDNKDPCASVRFGSASVPIHLSECMGRKRFIIAR
jgi:hypothetical protein